MLALFFIGFGLALPGMASAWSELGKPGLAWQYNPGYTAGMKTAISIPDKVFEAADRTAKNLGVSRSELYSTAVYEYIERHRIEDVTAKLDEIYSSEKSGLDESLRVMQSLAFEKEDW